MPLPDGRVDPTEPTETAAVLTAVLDTLGPGGLGDLIARMPGVTMRPGTKGGLFRAATPASYMLGEQDVLVFTPRILHEQVVGGVVLHRNELHVGTAPAALAALIGRLIATHGGYEEASVALTAAKETTARF